MKKRIVKKKQLKRDRPSIAEQLMAIPSGSKQEFSLADVNPDSYRTKIGEMNVKFGYSKYSMRTIREYNVMIITNNG